MICHILSLKLFLKFFCELITSKKIISLFLQDSEGSRFMLIEKEDTGIHIMLISQMQEIQIQKEKRQFLQVSTYLLKAVIKCLLPAKMCMCT